MLFCPVTPEGMQTALTTPNAQTLLLCHASWVNDASHCGPFRDAVLAAIPSTLPRGPPNMFSLDISQYPEVATQLEVSHIPTLFAIHSGRFVDKIVGVASNPPEIIKAFLSNFLAMRVVVAPSGVAPEVPTETCVKWLGIASSMLQKGNTFYAYKMYEKTLLAASTAETQLAAVTGLVLCAVIRGQLSAVGPHVDHIREMSPSHLALCVYDVTTAAATPDGVLTEHVSFTSVRAALTANPRDKAARCQLLLLYLLSGDAEHALTEVVKLYAIDPEVARVAMKACGTMYGEDHVLVLRARQFVTGAKLS